MGNPPVALGQPSGMDASDASCAAADPSAAGGQAASARPCLGIDVGGTFTDLALCIDGGALLCLKVASTPERPGFSTLQGVRELRRLAGCTDEDWRTLSHTHSNTVAYKKCTVHVCNMFTHLKLGYQMAC